MPRQEGVRNRFRRLLLPLISVRTSLADARLVRLQLAWAAVMVASWTTTVALSVTAFDQGGSRAVALAVLARAVPGAVAAPVVGLVVDRCSRARCLQVSAAVCALGSAVAVSPELSLPAVTALVTAVSLATMLFRTAQSAVLPELVDDPAALVAANVLSSSVEAVGLFAGPALAAGLLALRGRGLAFAAAAALFATAGALALLLPARSPTSDGLGGGRDGASGLLRLGVVRIVLALLFAQTVLSGALATLYPALAVDALELAASGTGLLTSAFGLGGVVGSVGLFALAGSRRLGLLSALALLLWALPLLILPLHPGLSAVLLLLAVVGGGNVLFDVTSVTLLQRGVPARLLGRAFGAVEAVVVAGLAAGAIAAPPLSGHAGPAATLALLSVPLAAVAVLAAPSLRRLDTLLAAPTRQVALLQEVPVFTLLGPLPLERLALHLRPRQLGAGQAAVLQGDVGRSWFVVDRGRFDVEVDGQPVAELGPGGTFGEIALLRTAVRTATVRAYEGGLLWELDADVFLTALRADGGRALSALDAEADDRLRRAAPGSQA